MNYSKINLKKNIENFFEILTENILGMYVINKI